MSAVKWQKVKSIYKTPSRTEIKQFYSSNLQSRSQVNMAEAPCAAPDPTSLQVLPAFLAPSTAPDTFLDPSVAFLFRSPWSPSHAMASPPLRDTVELRELIQALLTKVDIETLLLLLVETHRRDNKAIRTYMQLLTDRVSMGRFLLLHWITILEQKLSSRSAASAVALQLHLKDLEDRSDRLLLRPPIGPRDLEPLWHCASHLSADFESCPVGASWIELSTQGTRSQTNISQQTQRHHL